MTILMNAYQILWVKMPTRYIFTAANIMCPVAPRRPFHQDGRPDQQEEEGDVLGRDISLITAPIDKYLCLGSYKGTVVQCVACKWRRGVREAGKHAGVRGRACHVFVLWCRGVVAPLKKRADT